MFAKRDVKGWTYETVILIFLFLGGIASPLYFLEIIIILSKLHKRSYFYQCFELVSNFEVKHISLGSYFLFCFVYLILCFFLVFFFVVFFWQKVKLWFYILEISKNLQNIHEGKFKRFWKKYFIYWKKYAILWRLFI